MTGRGGEWETGRMGEGENGRNTYNGSPPGRACPALAGGKGWVLNNKNRKIKKGITNRYTLNYEKYMNLVCR